VLAGLLAIGRNCATAGSKLDVTRGRGPDLGGRRTEAAAEDLVEIGQVAEPELERDGADGAPGAPCKSRSIASTQVAALLRSGKKNSQAGRKVGTVHLV
jgi:hypothetical protein